ncbi:hypothetical protein RAN3_1857 [plant metagenome]|uniref:Mobile element protein n=1 Tax=plant metagenome TaxID=1297885 RepID=A0A484VAS2_9ZZZZ
MFEIVWTARAAYGLRWRTRLSWKTCWQIASSLAEHSRPDGLSPDEAVRDELSYWGSDHA